MFDINVNIKIKKEIIDEKPIYIIDDFYQSPTKILNFLLSKESLIHKKNIEPSFNQIYFDDRRHKIYSDEVTKVYKFLSNLCNQKEYNGNFIVTNLTRFYSKKFNNYKDNYWWPHKDIGYTGILYLNLDDEEYGTNLYKDINYEEENKNCPEHYEPWRKKNNYYLIKSLKPKFNRMILFDAFYFTHGMNICGDRYFGEEYRMNQVFFFDRKNDLD